MGIMDMFQNAGNSLIDSLTPKKKPGTLCIASCTINDIRCEACLAEQEKIQAALDELQNLEAAIENARNNPQFAEVRITKCSVCGAPFEKKEKECPYCGNKYPAGTVTANIPATEAERDSLLLQKASEAYGMYANMKKRVTENKNSDMKNKLPGVLGGMVSSVYTAASNFAANSFVDMTPQQIKQLARQNNVSYYSYITGVMQGAYKSAGDIKMQEIQQITKEYQEENARLRAEQRQIDRELRQKQQQSSMESYKRQMAFIASKPAPQYNGGPTRCCGTCKYYGAGKCCATGGKFEGWNRNASDDTCGWFSMK